MTIRILVVLSILGILAGILSVYYYQRSAVYSSSQPVPIHSNPYQDTIYASCIVDNAHPNIIIYPEISGRVKNITMEPGNKVKAGETILTIDDAVQQQLIEDDLKLIQQENAGLVAAEQQLNKIDSKNSLASTEAINAVNNARQRLALANSQYYADKKLLNKATVKAPEEGIVIKIIPSVGDYVSTKPDPHTHEKTPIVYLSLESPYMRARCFVDEMLIPQLPLQKKLEATMFVKGSNYEGINLDFVRIEPNVIPNPELMSERTERTNIRVLPILFRFLKPENYNIYPGQSVDVYIKR